MDGDLVKTFMKLAGQRVSSEAHVGSIEERKLGAQLLLSEVLEYVISGLGVIPEIDGVRIEDPEGVHYHEGSKGPDPLEMVDGVADVAYTMFWNALAFGLPIEQAYSLVCQNNLDKFVRLTGTEWTLGMLPPARWGCEQGVVWPEEVVQVEVLNVDGVFFAVGKDKRGKVRKPSTYQSVDLSVLFPFSP